MRLRRSHLATRLALVCGIILWLSAPIAAVVLIQKHLERASFVSPTEVWAPVAAPDQVTPEPVNIALSWAPAPQLLTPGSWSTVSTVGSVLLAPGDEVHSGTPVLVADGVTRLAVDSPQPFYRPLTLGSQGQDVRWLNRALGELGISHGSGDVIGEPTLAGITKLASRLGATAVQPAVFDPGWFVYLPDENFVVASVAVTVAGAPPAAGSTILTGVAPLSSAVVVPATFTPPAAAAGANDPSSADISKAANEARLTLQATQEVRLAGQPLQLSADRDAIDIDKSPALATAAASQTAATPLLAAEVLTTLSAQTGVKLPTPAVFNVPGGKSCVIARSPDGAARAVSVTVLSSGNGSAVVESSEIAIGDQVLLSPPNSRRSC